MKSLRTTFLVVTITLLGMAQGLSQIYAPEGLNMPGDWDGWTNPPENPVFAGEAQTGDGQLALVPLGQPVYQTTFHVAADGDVQAGDYSFKFTSGPLDDIWRNQWGDVSVALGTIQTFTYGTPDGEEPEPNTITLTDNKWYVMNWKNTGYEDTIPGTDIPGMEHGRLALIDAPAAVDAAQEIINGADDSVFVLHGPHCHS